VPIYHQRAHAKKNPEHHKHHKHPLSRSFRLANVDSHKDVFPPFGGQGIASGLRDAQQLAWRLFLLQRLPHVDPSLCSDALDAWARERVYSVRLAAGITRMNGQLCNEGDSWKFWLWRNVDWAIRQIPFLPDLPRPLSEREARGFKSVDGGFFAPTFNGGGRLPQVYLSSSHQTGPTLSDSVLCSDDSAMTIMILASDDPENDVADARMSLDRAKMHEKVLGNDSIRVVSSTQYSNPTTNLEVYYPTPLDDLSRAGISIRPLYSPSNLFSRFDPGTNFVILRADFFIYGLAKDRSELFDCLIHMHQHLHQTI
jgi:hypothetical protein